MLQFTCPHCSGAFQVDPSMAGQQAGCPTCHGIVQIPADAFGEAAPAAALPAVQSGVEAAAVLTPQGHQLCCPVCAGIFQVAPEMAGQEVLCPLCQARVTIPALGPQAQSVEVRPALTPDQAAGTQSPSVYDPPSLQGTSKQEAKLASVPLGGKPASAIEAYAPPSLPTSTPQADSAPSGPTEPARSVPSPFDPPTLPAKQPSEKEPTRAAPTSPAAFNPAKVVEQPRKLPPRPSSADRAQDATTQLQQPVPTSAPATPTRPQQPQAPQQPQQPQAPQAPVQSQSPAQTPVQPQSPVQSPSPGPTESPVDPQAPVERSAPAQPTPHADPQAPVHRPTPLPKQPLPDPQAAIQTRPSTDPQTPVRSDTQPQHEAAAIAAEVADPEAAVIDPETGQPILIHDAPTTVRQGDQIIQLRRLTPEEKARRRLIKNIFVVLLCAAVLAGYAAWALVFR